MVQKRVELTAVLFLAVILLAMPTTLYHVTSVPSCHESVPIVVMRACRRTFLSTNEMVCAENAISQTGSRRLRFMRGL